MVGFNISNSYQQDKFLELVLEEKESIYSFHGFSSRFIQRNGRFKELEHGVWISLILEVMQFFIRFKSVGYRISSNRQ